MTTSLPDVRVLRDGRAVLAESLVWDDGDDTLLWCDIPAGLLHRGRLDGPADGSTDVVLRLDPPLASFAPTDAGGFVVSSADRVVLTDAAGAVERELAPITHAHSGFRLNEGRVDPRGRWVTGSMDVTRGEPDGALYSIDGSGACRTLRGGVGTANGTDWTPDGRRVYYTDTTASTIYTAEYTADGDILEERPFVARGQHDGLVVDRDGGVWSALYGEGRVEHYSPDGALLDTVELPAPNVTSIGFAGRDLTTLVIASARENLTEQQLEQHPLSGGLFAVDASTAGQPTRRFRTR